MTVDELTQALHKWRCKRAKEMKDPNPKKIEMHPDHYFELKSDKKIIPYIGSNPHESFKFMGVEIELTSEVETYRIIEKGYKNNSI